MLSAIVGACLRHKGIVVALACLLLGHGIRVANDAKLDVFPDFVQPQVVIQTESPGLAPEQVEQLVTRPVETAVNGLGDQESIRSESIQGLSIITVVFKEGTDVFLARQLLAEKLGEIGEQLPRGVKSPRMTPLTSSTMDLLKIGLVAPGRSPMELRAFADWTLKPRLLAVPGVAKCSVFGGEVRQLQILLSPTRLAGLDLSLAEVVAAAREATGVVGAGFIETANQRITVQTEGQTLTARELARVPLRGAGKDGRPLLLGEVATVVEGAEPKFGDTLVMGQPGVLLTMSSQYGANTLVVTHALEDALELLKPLLAREGITLYPRLHRPATFVETALRNMRRSLLLGALLVVGVLVLFLGDLRTALISVTAIPLSLLTAIIVLEQLGGSLNTITLGGLAIALGEVVDDAIIDVENIFRRLRQNRLREAPRPVIEVVLDASMEVRASVVHATFIVALVFLPVLTLTGLQGSFFAPLALSYVLATMASLVVALTLTPTLSLLFFSGKQGPAVEPWLQRFLRKIYRRVLLAVARHPLGVIAASLAVCALAATQLRSVGGELLPEFREGHFVLQVSTAPGTSLKEMLRLGQRISTALLEIPHIATVEQQIGRAELGEDPWGPHRSELHVELAPCSAEEEEETAEAIRSLLAGVPGIQFEVLTFLGDRIGETISGETAPVVISIFGEDLDQLDGVAANIVDALHGLPGAEEIQTKAPPGAPRLVVHLRPERLEALGFRPVEILEAVQVASQGTVVGQTYQGNRVTEVVVRLGLEDLADAEALGGLEIRNAEGLRMPLREVAELEWSSGRFSILHEGARRRQTITCNPGGQDVAAFVESARERIASRVSLPAGVYVVFSGAAQAQAAATRQLIFHTSIAALGIVVYLGAIFRSWRRLFLVLANLPFALVGGVMAIELTALLGEPGEGGLTVGALVGFVTLFGITTRSSILMISHFEHLVKVEGCPWNLEMAIRGAEERLVPILMTALVTALGLAPLALGAGEAGREIEGPMAIVILGGLITSTALNLIVLPTLALRYARFQPGD